MKPADELAQWVALKHEGQVKKYTGEPYFNHLMAVATLAKDATLYGYETGLCHDLLEDTNTTEAELTLMLQQFGYTAAAAIYITACVVELTDVFTAKAYPKLSRDERKEREWLRMATINSGSQTVKYADLADNMKKVIQYDPANAKPYLEKKRSLLSAMNKGDEKLRRQVLEIIQQGLSE